MNETGKRYNPVGRTEAFTDQVKNSIQAMYERGYNDGKNDTIETDRMEAGKLTEDAAIKLLQLSGWMENHDKEITESEYQRGLDDMQNALLAIDKWNNDHKALVFHGSLGSISILRDHNSKYIVDEVRKYQEEQAMQAAKIAVGDEVTYDDDRGVVLMIANNGQTIMVLSAKGGWLIRANIGEVKKTGRSFPDVEKLLDKLKEGKDD